jgi:hypothetical protein
VVRFETAGIFSIFSSPVAGGMNLSPSVTLMPEDIGFGRSTVRFCRAGGEVSWKIY